MNTERPAKPEPTMPASTPKPRWMESKDGPSYYERIPVQPIEYMHLVMSKEEFRGYCIGNIMKYLSRYGHKDDPQKEAKKVADYARWLFENESSQPLSVRGRDKESGRMNLSAEDRARVDSIAQELMGRKGADS